MRQISRIEVKHFKSLVDFEVDLAKFTCLIGMNGAGKSTVLQLIDFLSQLVQGDVTGWLRERKWKATDLKSKLQRKENIDFGVEFSDENGRPAGRWEGTYSPQRNRCTRERIELPDATLEILHDSVNMGAPNAPLESFRIAFDYEGSILSSLKEELLSPSLLECKRFLREIKSLDLLAPEHLRQRTRESSGTIGLGGQKLSAFLHEMTDLERKRLLETLKHVYPRLDVLHARSLRSGWKQLEIIEGYVGSNPSSLQPMKTEARHISDGTLRLIAILAELQSAHPFLLFDEIENGINPELVEFVIEALTTTPKQVVVTTHSPMILNYIEDETARRGVIYLYKTQRGHTRAVPFFSIPSLAEKLTVMGPGEAFVDTNLTELETEIEAISEGP